MQDQIPPDDQDFIAQNLAKTFLVDYEPDPDQWEYLLVAIRRVEQAYDEIVEGLKLGKRYQNFPKDKVTFAFRDVAGYRLVIVDHRGFNDTARAIEFAFDTRYKGRTIHLIASEPDAD